jgi:hypothetical protein
MRPRSIVAVLTLWLIVVFALDMVSQTFPAYSFGSDALLLMLFPVPLYAVSWRAWRGRPSHMAKCEWMRDLDPAMPRAHALGDPFRDTSRYLSVVTPVEADPAGRPPRTAVV